MTKKRQNKNVKPVYVWTWIMNGELCHFAEGKRYLLVKGGKPSPEAKPVKVKMQIA
jgi:hypothetical protein